MNALRLLLIVVLSIALAGCEVIGGIFKAGFWTGMILLIVILAVIAWIASKVRRR